MDKNLLDSIIKMVVHQWLANLSRQRNFYMSSVMRDLTRLNGQVNDLKSVGDNKSQLGDLLSSLGAVGIGGEKPVIMNQADTTKLIKEEVAKFINK